MQRKQIGGSNTQLAVLPLADRFLPKGADRATGGDAKRPVRVMVAQSNS